MDIPNNLPARLYIEYGPDAGRVIEIAAPNFVIGRSEDNHLSVNDRKISRQHAAITREAARYYLSDLGSRNGTFLNRQRVGRERQPLNTGDEIQLGALLVLRFEDPATTVADLPNPILTRGLWLDVARREVYVQRQLLNPPLTDKLFNLLGVLVTHEGRVVSKDQIAAHVWPEAVGGVTDQMIDSLVARLRRRLAQADAGHDYIVRVRGSGLRFVQRE